MYVPTLAEDGDDRCFGIYQGLKVGIFVWRILEIPGAAECGNLCMTQIVVLDFPEILD